MKHLNNSPFKLSNTKEYQVWREQKLKGAQKNKEKPVIKIKKTPPTLLTVLNDSQSVSSINLANTHEEINHELTDTILQECNRDNYCLYSIEDYKQYDAEETRLLVRLFAQSFGLSTLDGNLCVDNDGLTSVCISDHKGQHEYIPYTNKKLNWHTDGYYNLPENTINSMLLHCFRSAKDGGESAFLDHEIAYILLRDENPEWIKALSLETVMTIPENVLDGKVIRPQQSGPVFSITPQGRLHMRFSARQKNIIWKQDNATLDALTFLQNLLHINEDDHQNVGSDYITRHKLKPGEGIISRNILHCRTSFDSSFDSNKKLNEQRLLFRGRYYDELPSDISTLQTVN